MIDKQLVRSRFSKASLSYDQQAVAQKKIAAELILLLSKYPFSIKKVLEVGCGSGFLTKSLLRVTTPDKLFINDLYPLQEQLAQLLEPINYQFIEGDAEKLVWKEKFSLIVSSSTLQWFNDPEGFIRKCNEHLLPEGILAFSTFLPGNLSEIKQLTGVGLNYLPLETWYKMVNPYFDVIAVKSEVIKLHFPSPHHVLKHLRATGVNGISPQQWTRNHFQRFTEAYETFFHPSKGFELTYTPVYFIVRKKNA